MKEKEKEWVKKNSNKNYNQHLSSDPAWMKLFRWDSNDVVEEGEEDRSLSELHGRVFTVNRHWIGNIKASNMTQGNISDVCISTLRSRSLNNHYITLRISRFLLGCTSSNHVRVLSDRSL